MIDRSGSCAITSLFVGNIDLSLILLLEDMCYIANVGDSRAIMSGDGGNYIIELSTDHKPNSESE
jgi:protein phosphatase 2C family protein 2/3